MSDVDVAVIGAGVTGLATAAQLSAAGHSVCIVERRPRAGMETSTHNSGVIHAGLYYPQGSLKAQLCIEGAARLYAFCAARNVPHDRCGKLVVATSPEEEPLIEALAQRGHENGAPGLELVGRQFIHAREPHINGRTALWSPGTGRVNAEALIRALARIAGEHDAMWLPDTPLVGGEPAQGRFLLRTSRETIAARVVVNAAGLGADDVSTLLGGEAFRIYGYRGEYAALKKTRTHWVNGLVYPVPLASGHGLGVHLTPLLDGSVLLGPTSIHQDDKTDYESNRLPLDHFVEAARPLLPELTLDDLTYGPTGIRPKLHPPSEHFADFMIRPDAGHPNLIHAAGIESPGLTSCLSIGARVAALVQDALG